MIDHAKDEAAYRAQVLMPAVRSVVKHTAMFIRDAGKAFHSGHIEYKGEGNLVSYVDRESERMLVEGLEQILPGSGFLGEEGADIRPEVDFRWIIDPLDGTTNFMHGLPHYAISVALQFQGKTILGVVEDVEAGETYHAVSGRGAFLDETQIRVSEASALNRSLLCMGFPYPDSAFNLDDYLAVLRSFVSVSRGMRRMGAAALDLAWVASGRLDGFYEWGLQAWDVAAAALVIEEAGGRVSDFQGTDNFVFGRQIVASGPAIHEEMLKVIKPHFRP